MKKRFVIVNFFMAVTVLLSILFQSVHSYEHFQEHIAEFCSEHKDVSAQPVITHSHHSSYDECGICDFVFSPFTSVDVLASYHITSEIISEQLVIHSPQAADYFKGSLFALRGPPTV